MTKPELARRMLTVPYSTFLKAIRLVREGNGNLTLQCDVTRKQCNAAHEWVMRYGRINPQPEQCAPSGDADLTELATAGVKHVAVPAHSNSLYCKCREFLAGPTHIEAPRYVNDGGTEHGYLITSWNP